MGSAVSSRPWRPRCRRLSRRRSTVRLPARPRRSANWRPCSGWRCWCWSSPGTAATCRARISSPLRAPMWLAAGLAAAGVLAAVAAARRGTVERADRASGDAQRRVSRCRADGPGRRPDRPRRYCGARSYRSAGPARAERGRAARSADPSGPRSVPGPAPRGEEAGDDAAVITDGQAAAREALGASARTGRRRACYAQVLAGGHRPPPARRAAPGRGVLMGLSNSNQLHFAVAAADGRRPVAAGRCDCRRLAPWSRSPGSSG